MFKKFFKGLCIFLVFIISLLSFGHVNEKDADAATYYLKKTLYFSISGAYSGTSLNIYMQNDINLAGSYYVATKITSSTTVNWPRGGTISCTLVGNRWDIRFEAVDVCNYTPYIEFYAGSNYGYHATGFTSSPATQIINTNLSSYETVDKTATYVGTDTFRKYAGVGFSSNLAVVWTPNTHTIKYDANGGTGAPANQTKTYGSALTLSSTKPTRTGYTFTGWKIVGEKPYISDPNAIYDGVDYSPVFNWRDYYNYYWDLRNAFGENPSALLYHFVTGGIREGRRASAYFSIGEYMDNNGDLRAAFGTSSSDYGKYISHYLNGGRYESRYISSAYATLIQPGSSYKFDHNNGRTITLQAQWTPNTYTQTIHHYKYNTNTSAWDYWKTTTASAKYNTVFTPAYDTPTGYYNYSRDYNSGWTVTGNGTFAVRYHPNAYTQSIQHYVYNTSTKVYDYKSTTAVNAYYNYNFNPRNYSNPPTGYKLETSLSSGSYTITGAKTVRLYYFPSAVDIYIDGEKVGPSVDNNGNKFVFPTTSNKVFTVTFNYDNANIENETKTTTSVFLGYGDSNGNILYSAGDEFTEVSTTAKYFYRIFKTADEVEMPTIPDTNDKVSTGYWYKVRQAMAPSQSEHITKLVPTGNMTVYAYWNNKPTISLGTTDGYYRNMYTGMKLNDSMLLYNISSTDEEDSNTTLKIKELLIKKSNDSVRSITSNYSNVKFENDDVAYKVIYTSKDKGTVKHTDDKALGLREVETKWYPVLENKPPVLYVTDKYIYSKDNTITVDNIIRVLCNIQHAVDEEIDGDVSHWLTTDSKVEISVESFEYKGIRYTEDIAEKMIEIKESGETTYGTVEYKATDCGGTSVYAIASLYFVNADNDTSMSHSNTVINIRHISLNTLDTLNPNSKWVLNPELNAMLKESLSKNEDSPVTSETIYKDEEGNVVEIKRYY